MSETTVCPWCTTEIIWDEVLGPESECPYCHNELQSYRTLSVAMDEDEDRQDRDDLDSSSEDGEKEEKGWSNFGWGDEAMLFASSDELQYQEGVDRLLQEQQDVPECPQCREYMLLLGQEKVSDASFVPHTPEGVDDALIHAPFELQVYACTSCFQVTKRLGQSEQKALQDRLRAISEANKSEDKQS